MTSTSPTRIALLIGQDLGYCRSLLNGIRKYASSKPDWTFRIAPPVTQSVKPIKGWNPDGVIAHLYDRKVAQHLKRLSIPVINTTSTLDLDFPLVDVNHEQVGEMAAEFFLSKKFSSFGYLGSKVTGFSKGRENGFVRRLKENNFTVSKCYIEYLPQPKMDANWPTIDKQVVAWLQNLAKPVAVFTSNDIPARDLGDACVQLGVNVPREVAILGVDNDEFQCSFSRPPLSSVAIPGVTIGYESARMLDQLLAGDQPDRDCLSLPPIRVVERLSTDMIAIDDPVVADALTFIRDHYQDDIGVTDTAKTLDVSRRTLERLFRQKLGRSVLDEIRYVRIVRAKELLTETDSSIETISSRTGFSSGRRLALVFRQVVGLSPTEFRNTSRFGSG